jgi:hypothetical protein
MKQINEIFCHALNQIKDNQIPGTIIANIVCSLLIDIQGGRLLFITKTDHTEYVERSSPNGLTPSAANESLTLQGSSLKIDHFYCM